MRICIRVDIGRDIRVDIGRDIRVDIGRDGDRRVPALRWGARWCE
jgi:hypothetical protein